MYQSSKLAVRTGLCDSTTGLHSDEVKEKFKICLSSPSLLRSQKPVFFRSNQYAYLEMTKS